MQTIKFFDLQDLPLTLIELHIFLLQDMEIIKQNVNEQWELNKESASNPPLAIDEILTSIEKDCSQELGCLNGFYFLKGRQEIVIRRLKNYLFGINREKLIKKYIGLLCYIPFVRGVALAGSQALGQQKDTSDIDLLIITDSEFLWLTRTLVTAYFELVGKRRHGPKITNRFCLNHYIATPKEVNEYKNIYTASEYIKLRPLVYKNAILRFQFNNQHWIKQFFPNFNISKPELTKQKYGQKILESIFNNKFGYWVEERLKGWQLPKIRTNEKYIVVKDDELSFHPMSKQEYLLEKFFSR